MRCEVLCRIDMTSCNNAEVNLDYAAKWLELWYID